MSDLDLIWYKFGVRSRQLLTDFEKLDLDNLNVKDLEYLQIAAAKAKQNLAEELELYLKLHPDE